MRIECPSCSAAYDVPPERLAAGRTVKCARCAGMWTPVPAQPLPLPPEPEPEIPPGAAQPEPAAPPGQTGPLAPPMIPAVQKPRSRAPLALAWLLSIAVLAVLGWAAIDRRATIMQAWPPSVRAYAAIGLAQ